MLAIPFRLATILILLSIRSGATPGNVLTSSSNWSSDFANLMNCINNHTTKSTCVAPSTTPDVTAHGKALPPKRLSDGGISNPSPLGSASGYPSVYTSTYGPSFGPGKFIYGKTFAGDGTAYHTHAVIEQLPVSQKFTVNRYIYPQTNTPSSTYVSSTGILTLHFASAPIDTSGAVGLPITVDGYSGPNVGLNGTWPITSIAASVLTVNVPSHHRPRRTDPFRRRSRRGQSLRPRHGRAEGSSSY